MMAPALAGFFCLVLLGILAVILIVAIFYLLTLQKALSRVSPENRLMEPGLVWLMLIPIFNLVWQFFIATRVPGSLRNEFRARGRDDGSDYGRSIGLTKSIIIVVNAVAGNVLGLVKETAGMANVLSGLLSLASLVLFIIFWVKIAGYSNRLAMDPKRGSDFERDVEDYDDRFPSKRRRGDELPPDSYRAEDPGQYK